MITLRQGSSGPYVIQLKKRLEGAGYPTPPGPLFDTDTHRAVRQFQAAHQDSSGRPLDVDGVVGDATWEALGGPPGPLVEHANARGSMVALIALKEASRGVREHGGNNRGTDVEMYQRATGLPGTGWPWCAAFVTWCYESAGLLLRDANGFAAVAALRRWAEHSGYWRPREQGYWPPMGAIVIYTFSHTGIIVSAGDQADKTVEGNTSSGARGSQRDGGGVFQRTRLHRAIRGYVVMPDIVAN
ncbi:MAG: peptidoglycan-binding protein [Myxococcota bacterium]